MRKATYKLLFIVMLSGSLAFASDFRAKESVINLVSGAGELVIVGDGLIASEAQDAAKAVVTDSSSVMPKLQFKLDETKIEHPSGNSVVWHFQVRADGAVPQAPVVRQLQFSLPGQSNGHAIAVTLASQKTAGWSVDGPTTPWNLSQSRAIDFVVVTVGGNFTKVSLTHSSLIDSSAGKNISVPLKNLHICKALPNNDDGLGQCSQTATLDSGKTTLWLAMDKDFHENGTFAGSIQLDTDPIGDTKSIPLTIQQSGGGSQLLGGVLIGAGVAIAWFVLAYGRTQVSRAQALLPATLLREKVADLLLRVGKLPQPLLSSAPITNEVLRDLLTKLSEAFLDAQNYLPPSLPSISANSPVQLGNYQVFLQACSGKIDGLAIIVIEGLEHTAQKFTPNIDPAHLKSLQDLTGSLDALTGTLPQQDATLRASISNLFKSFTQVVVAANAQALSLAMPAPQPKTTVELRVQIHLITAAFWLVWGGLSLLLGIAVLILANPGFGSAMDYIRCVFWGFGLPVAGQSLLQVTQSNFNSNFGVTLSR